MVRYSPRAEWVSRVEKEKFRVPPSGLKPQATAMPSSRVDFPAPFSPTRKVTGLSKASRSPARSWARAGSRFSQESSDRGRPRKISRI